MQAFTCHPIANLQQSDILLVAVIESRHRGLLHIHSRGHKHEELQSIVHSCQYVHVEGIFLLAP